MELTNTENNNENSVDNQIKQEVVSAYHEVLRILKDSPNTQEKLVEEELVKQEQHVVIDIINDEPPESLVNSITNLKNSLNKTLDDLKQRLLPEYEKFFTVRQAIEYSENELRQLHNIKVSAGTLTALVQAHKEKMAAYETELAQCRQSFAQEKVQMAIELEKEEADFTIRRDAKRKLDQEKYEHSKREVEKAQAEKRAAFEEEFVSREARIAAREKDHQLVKDREAWILAREQEYHQLKERAGYHAEELRLAVQKVERATADKLTSKYEYEAKLMHIETESDRKMYQQKIATLEEQIERYKSLKPLFKETETLSDEPVVATEERSFSDQSTQPSFSYGISIPADDVSLSAKTASPAHTPTPAITTIDAQVVHPEGAALKSIREIFMPTLDLEEEVSTN